MATEAAAPVLRHRLGAITLETLPYNQPQKIGDAVVSFHPAGHVPGSAQIRVEVADEIWVASGDYKTTDDALSEPFEPVRCHSFITESTFGLPVFRWPTQETIALQINRWWKDCIGNGVTPVLGAYSLGKAQRVLSLLDPDIGPILTHTAIENTTQVLRDQGIRLPETVHVTPDMQETDTNGLVLAPPSALSGAWLRRFGTVSTGFASGWMQLRGIRRRRSADRGFVISDHADWNGLNDAITATCAERVFVTHGYTEVFTQWLNEKGLDAAIVPTEFKGETLQDDAAG